MINENLEDIRGRTRLMRLFLVLGEDMDMCQPRDALETLQFLKHQRNKDQFRSGTRTGGLTNHAVSQSSSFHRRFTKLSTSDPACFTIASSSSVPFGDTTILSNVTPQSARAGKHDGRKLGDGGGDVNPVNPQSPS